MTEIALEARHLRKAFGALVVTDDVSLTIQKGARHALIGPNGAGKTTLVGLLSGIIRPDAGSILLHGHDATRDRPEQRVQRGLVRTFQVTNLFRGLTLFDNLFQATSQYLGASRNMIQSAAKRSDVIACTERVIEQLNLQDDAGRIVSEIAYGRQRLVELGIALSLRPKVLLLDEPAAGIPSSELHRLLDAVDALPRDIAILMIEHDMQVVRRFASAVTVLVQGRELMTGTPAEVMASPNVRRVYLGQSGHARFEGTSLNA